MRTSGAGRAASPACLDLLGDAESAIADLNHPNLVRADGVGRLSVIAGPQKRDGVGPGLLVPGRNPARSEVEGHVENGALADRVKLSPPGSGLVQFALEPDDVISLEVQGLFTRDPAAQRLVDQPADADGPVPPTVLVSVADLGLVALQLLAMIASFWSVPGSGDFTGPADKAPSSAAIVAGPI